MPDPKDIARIADKKEETRISEVRKLFNQEGKFSIIDILGSEEILKILGEKPISLSPSLGEAYPSLPLNSLLYSKNVVEICPLCLKGNASLIKPYLERRLILPILSQPLAEYRSDFIDLIIQYPYIGSESLDAFRTVQPCMDCPNEGKKEAPECPHNPDNIERYDKYCKKITKDLLHSGKDKALINKYRHFVESSALSRLYPLYNEEGYVLQQLDEAISQKRFDLIIPLVTEAFELYGLRLSKSFKAVPQVCLEDLLENNRAINRLKIPLDSNATKPFEDRNWIAEALGIKYDSKMPIEEYLDIIVPRKKKINSLIDSFISKKDADLRNSINDEIWKINEELTSSKTMETLNYLTTFTSNNAGLISGLIIGGLLGCSSASLLGCGFEGIAGTAGSIGASIVAKIAQKHEVTKKLNIPKPPRKTVEWIKEKVETQEEKMLAKMLSKEIPVIQVWSLRKKLEKYN